jgi:hypothetical protein
LEADTSLEGNHLPPLGHIAEQVDAGGFEFDVRIEAEGDGAVDDRLLLLVQKRDDPLLCADQLRRLK